MRWYLPVMMTLHNENSTLCLIQFRLWHVFLVICWNNNFCWFFTRSLLAPNIVFWGLAITKGNFFKMILGKQMRIEIQKMRQLHTHYNYHSSVFRLIFKVSTICTSSFDFLIFVNLFKRPDFERIYQIFGNYSAGRYACYVCVTYVHVITRSISIFYTA